MEIITKDQSIKNTRLSKKVKPIPEQHVCEKGNENKIKRADNPVKMLDNWLIAESKYRGFYF
jgi:hypothetical protein